MGIEDVVKSLKGLSPTGGIYGKTTLLLIVLCICVATVSAKVDQWWATLALMLPLMGIVFYALKRCLDFAESNPPAAIMDGADLLAHERIMHGQKGREILAPTPQTIDHELPPLLPQEVAAEDPPPKPALPNNGNHPENGGH